MLYVIVGFNTPIPTERKPFVPYIVGVNTPIPIERKPYVLYVADVGSFHTFSRGRIVFLHIVHYGVATSTLFWNTYEKVWV